jgi:hypothetical protein
MFRINKQSDDRNDMNDRNGRNNRNGRDNVGNSYESRNYTGVDQLKKQLIDYIYSSVNMSKFKYELLQHENELPQLAQQKYFVSANFSGASSLLVFTKIKDKFSSYIIDRKTLSYNPEKIDIPNVKMTNIKLKLDTAIYSGTIFDGVFVTNRDERMFIITDVYMFKGRNNTNTQLDMKMITIKSYLEENYDESDRDNSVVLTVNMLNSIERTDYVVNTLIPKIKNVSVRGICFYPELSGTKLIYLFGNESRQTNTSQQKSNTSLRHERNVPKPMTHVSHTRSLPQTNNLDDDNDNNGVVAIKTTPHIVTRTVYVPKNDVDDDSYIFEMKKNNTVDVYDLSIVEKHKKTSDSKVMLRRIKVGLAYIPNIKRSIWCREALDENDSILVNCKFHDGKKKWEPIEISDGKRPSYVSEFDTDTV